MKKIIYAIIIVLLIVFAATVSIKNTNNQNKIEGDAVSQTETTEEYSYFKNWEKTRPKVKGIYVTGPTAGSERMSEILELIDETELNTIVLDVKDDAGNITFNMQNDDVKATEACIPYIHDIDALMKTLKSKDIYVIARIPCFKDPVLSTAVPEVALKTATGEPVTDANGNAWVNPCDERVWDYLISIAKSCKDIGFDEVQFDYVRFPVGQNAADAIYNVELDDTVKQEYINRFLDKAVKTLHDYDMPVTADVFGTIIKSDLDAAHVGQNYKTLASSTDILCPMIYPSHYADGEFGLAHPDVNPYETIYASLTGSKNILSDLPADKCATIRPWLQAFTASWLDYYIEYDADAIQKQIQAVYDAGYDEWILWNSGSHYDKSWFEAQ